MSVATLRSDTLGVIQVAVADLEATEAFYAGILDLPVSRVPTPLGAPEHLVLETKGITVIFVQEDAVVEEHPVLEEGLAVYPKGIGITLHFQVTGIESVLDAVAEEELELVYPLKIHPYGIKEFWCRDPDGYLIAVEEPIPRGGS